MIDHNRDGFIDKEDLHDMLASLGKVMRRTTRQLVLVKIFIILQNMPV